MRSAKRCSQSRYPRSRGSFLRFCELLGGRSVTEFNYRYRDSQAAQVFVGLALDQGKAERAALVDVIGRAGFSVRDMTDNEMAKLHVRYMVGGPAPGLKDERLYRFEFPERPGALLQFLRPSARPGTSAFSTIAITARITAACWPGFRFPPDTHTDFMLHVNELQYPYNEETDNPAYQIFLGC